MKKRAKQVKGELGIDTFEAALAFLPGWSIAPTTLTRAAGEWDIRNVAGITRGETKIGADGGALRRSMKLDVWGYAGKNDPRYLGGESASAVAEALAVLNANARVLPPPAKRGKFAPPSDPEVDRLYLSHAPEPGVEHAETGPPPWMTHFALIQFPAWVGVEGFRITAPDGESFAFEPPAHGSPTPGSVLTWLYAHGLAAAAEAALPAAEAAVPPEVTVSNSGRTCSVCFRAQEVDSRRRLVHHGYQRPGWGHIVGDCEGVGWEPFERSCEGTKAYLTKLETSAAAWHETLEAFAANMITRLFVKEEIPLTAEDYAEAAKNARRGQPAPKPRQQYRSVEIGADDARWDNAWQSARATALVRYRRTWQAIATYRAIIRAWTPQPDAKLPVGLPRTEKIESDRAGYIVFPEQVATPAARVLAFEPEPEALAAVAFPTDAPWTMSADDYVKLVPAPDFGPEPSSRDFNDANGDYDDEAFYTAWDTWNDKKSTLDEAHDEAIEVAKRKHAVAVVEALMRGEDVPRAALYESPDALDTAYVDALANPSTAASTEPAERVRRKRKAKALPETETDSFGWPKDGPVSRDHVMLWREWLLFDTLTQADADPVAAAMVADGQKRGVPVLARGPDVVSYEGFWRRKKRISPVNRALADRAFARWTDIDPRDPRLISGWDSASSDTDTWHEEQERAYARYVERIENEGETPMEVDDWVAERRRPASVQIVLLASFNKAAWEIGKQLRAEIEGRNASVEPDMFAQVTAQEPGAREARTTRGTCAVCGWVGVLSPAGLGLPVTPLHVPSTEPEVLSPLVDEMLRGDVSDECVGADKPPEELSPAGLVALARRLVVLLNKPATKKAGRAIEQALVAAAGNALVEIALWAPRKLPGGEQPASFPSSGFVAASAKPRTEEAVVEAALEVLGSKAPPELRDELVDWLSFMRTQPQGARHAKALRDLA